jgi:hypothetical protein
MLNESRDPHYRRWKLSLMKWFEQPFYYSDRADTILLKLSKLA